MNRSDTLKRRNGKRKEMIEAQPMVWYDFKKYIPNPNLDIGPIVCELRLIGKGNHKKTGFAICEKVEEQWYDRMYEVDFYFAPSLKVSNFNYISSDYIYSSQRVDIIRWAELY